MSLPTSRNSRQNFEMLEKCLSLPTSRHSRKNFEMLKKCLILLTSRRDRRNHCEMHYWGQFCVPPRALNFKVTSSGLWFHSSQFSPILIICSPKCLHQDAIFSNICFYYMKMKMYASGPPTFSSLKTHQTF